MCYDRGTLQAYLDGQLPTHRTKHVGDHVAACPACNEVLRELGSNAAFTDAAIENLNVVNTWSEDTATAWRRLVATMGQERRRWTFFGGGWWAVSAIAASLIITLFVGTAILDNRSERTTVVAERGPAIPPALSSKDRDEVKGLSSSKSVAAPSSPLKDQSVGPELSIPHANQYGLEKRSDDLEKRSEDDGYYQNAAKQESAERQKAITSLSGQPNPCETTPAMDKDTKSSASSPRSLSTATLDWSAGLHTPVDPSTVREVYVQPLCGVPASVAREEGEQVVAWFNSGVVTEVMPIVGGNVAAGGMIVKIVLTDGREITLSHADAGQLMVATPQGAYLLVAPDLSVYMQKKGVASR